MPVYDVQNETVTPRLTAVSVYVIIVISAWTVVFRKQKSNVFYILIGWKYQINKVTVRLAEFV